MNKEQVLTKLLESLAEVIGWVKATKTFVLAQAPDICREIVLWTVWSNGAKAVVLGVVGFIIFRIMIILLNKHGWVGEKKDNPAPAIFVVIFGFFILFLGPEIYEGVLQVIQALVAPKLTIINYLMNLTK